MSDFQKNYPNTFLAACTQRQDTSCTHGNILSIQRCISCVIDEANVQLAEANGTMQGHDKPCYYCNKPCNSLAGNPDEWGIPLCHADDPGRVKWHHIGCVSSRLERLSAEIELQKDFANRLGQRAHKAEATVERLSKDAQRYQWLHQFNGWSWTKPPMRAISFTWLIHCTKEDLDAAIDAAIEANKPSVIAGTDRTTAGKIGQP